jgi:hypothetical protein
MEAPKHLDMELIVQLSEDGLATSVVDWITGQDVSHLVYKLILEPGKCRALLYRLNEDGKLYRHGDRVARYHKPFPVVKIYGKSVLRWK